MSATDLWLLSTLFALIVSASVLGAAEAALLRVPRVRIEIAASDGDARSRTMLALLNDLPRVLNTVLLVVLLVQIAAATIAGTLAVRLFGSLGVTLASFALTFVLFVYSEAIPKTYAVRNPETVARATAPLLRFLARLLRPVVSVLVRFADLQAPGTGIASPTAPTEEELLHMASEAAATGLIEESDRVLIDRAFALGDLKVDDIYVPRLDIVSVSNDLSVREGLDFALASGHRRIPIYDGNIDNIVGIVRLSDLAAASLERPESGVASIAHEPLVVPESKRVIELLDEMQRADNHFAVVIDEYGGTAGIVTIEDVAARLVGPILHEGEPATTGIDRIDATTWIVAGATDTDDLERALDLELPEGEWNTLAGLLIGHAGRIPGVGETFTITGARFEVTEALNHRITRVRITRL
ncbi:MAG: hemolysin family protein [Actinomycetota bacterium]|nr:hemolysin family protein [Actinomycetota bacterium]